MEVEPNSVATAFFSFSGEAISVLKDLQITLKIIEEYFFKEGFSKIPGNVWLLSRNKRYPYLFEGILLLYLSSTQ
jgi:hypothetical protein